MHLVMGSTFRGQGQIEAHPARRGLTVTEKMLGALAQRLEAAAPVIEGKFDIRISAAVVMHQIGPQIIRFMGVGQEFKSGMEWMLREFPITEILIMKRLHWHVDIVQYG